MALNKGSMKGPMQSDGTMLQNGPVEKLLSHQN